MDTLCNKRRKKERKKLEKKKLNERLIRDRIIRDIRTLSEQHEEDYYKSKRVSNWNDNNIEYESNFDKNRNQMNILIKLNLSVGI